MASRALTLTHQPSRRRTLTGACALAALLWACLGSDRGFLSARALREPPRCPLGRSDAGVRRDASFAPAVGEGAAAVGWACRPLVAAVAAVLGAAHLAGRARRGGDKRRVARADGADVEPSPGRAPSSAPTSDNKKTVIITGASSGLGLAAATQLAKCGEWHIIMACRDFSKAEKVAQEAQLDPDSYTVLHLDLASNKSVCLFVDSFRALGRPLDVLVCNAAVYFPNADKKAAILPGLWSGGGPRWSADDFELSFAANYLGHFLLTNLLLPELQSGGASGPGRCVILGTVTASVNEKDVGGMIPPLADVGNFEGLEQGMKEPIAMVDGGKFIGAKAYKDSKVCCVLMCRELHRRFHESTGIVFTSLYPGCITDTGLFREHYPAFRVFWPLLMKKVVKSYVSNEEAGQRLAKCVADPLYNTSGSYFSWGGEAGTGGTGGTDAADNLDKSSDVFQQEGSFRTLPYSDVRGQAGSEGKAKKLWELSEKLVGLE